MTHRRKNCIEEFTLFLRNIFQKWGKEYGTYPNEQGGEGECVNSKNLLSMGHADFNGIIIWYTDFIGFSSILQEPAKE